MWNFRIVLTFFISIFLVSTLSQAQLNTLGKVQKTLSSAEKVVSKTSEYVSAIDAAVETVKNNNLYKALIDGKEFTFPVAILPDNADKNYALIIRSVSMTPEGLFAEIVMKIPVGSDRSLYFLADKVPFSRTGGIAGDLRLYLLRTDSVTVGKGYSILFDGLEKGGEERSCFVTFNCKGFKDATLSGAVNFNKSSIVKDAQSKEQVSIKYYIQADKLSNFIIQLNDVPSFEFTNLPGFKCTVPSITLDKSDIKNAPDFALPSWYRDSIRVLVNDAQLVVDGPEWEGMFIPTIDIEIPRSFKEDKPDEIVLIKSRDLIVDQNGVSGLNSAENVLDGKIKGWTYSIDSIRVNIIASSLSRGAFFGKVTLPIAKEESQVDFGLVLTKKMTDNDISYKGYINIERNGGLVDAEAFGMAKIKLTQAKFDFEYTNKQFYPAAVLTGNLTISPKKNSSSSKSFASFGVDFALLRVTSKQPYMGIDDGGFVKMSSQGSMMSNFPVSISELGLKKDNGGQRIGIYMTLNIKLQKSGGDSQGSNGFGGSASFTVWTKRDPVVQKWRYDNFDLDKIIIQVDNSSFSLYGELSTFEDDIEYGTGVCGYLQLKVIKKLEVKAAAIFGRKGQIVIDPNTPITDADMAETTSTYRYWFVDAMASFPVITVAPFVGINGFTGGLYHNMKLTKSDPSFTSFPTDGTTSTGTSTSSTGSTTSSSTSTTGSTSGSTTSTGSGTSTSSSTVAGSTTSTTTSTQDAISGSTGTTSGGTSTSSTSGSSSGTTTNSVTPTGTMLSSTVSCRTASGMKYTPDDNIYLGLMAGVGLQSVPTEAVFNGTITFGLEFNKSGGLNMVALWGGVTLVTPPLNVPNVNALKDKMDIQADLNKKKQDIKSEPPAASEGSVRVNWFTQYDVPNKTFIGDFDVFVDLAGVIKGVGPGSKAGHIAVLFSPQANYVYVGTPLTPVGIEVASLFKCTSYFCAGNKLPSPPIAPLPSEIRTTKPIDYNALETGAGLSFGARVELGGRFGAGGDLLGCNLWVGAEISVKAGFDVLISKSNQPVYCSDVGRRGINDWYATGQAFIAGGLRLGLDYDCGIVGSGTKNLLSASMWAYLFAQLPKPSYMVGEVHAEFEVLGIGGSATIGVEFGDQCQRADQDKNIVFISSILPTDSTTNVKVTEQVIVNFAKPIQKFTFMLPDESNPGSTVPYRGVVGANEVSILANGRPITFKMDWNSTMTQLVLTPYSVLPENAAIKVTVKVLLQSPSGTSSKSETKTITFFTGKEPSKIETSNVAYSYPLPGMKNYYRMESNTGYIKLATLPKKPMTLASGFAYNVVFEKSGSEVARVTNITVNNTPGVEQFVYTIPNEKLVNSENYTLKVVKTLLNKQEREVEQEGYTLGYANETPEDSVVLEYSFTTSRFSTFAQKVAYYNQNLTEISGLSVTHTLFPNIKEVDGGTAEGFSTEETNGFTANGVKTTKQLLKSLGADFSSGFIIKGNVPDSVAYSYYGNKLVVQYNVFSEINQNNQDSKLSAITCSINQTQADCTGGSTSFTFPKAKYYYRLGYFLPGRDQKTSEVVVSFELPEAISIQ